MENKSIGGIKLISKFVREVFPEVEDEITEYMELSQLAEDRMLAHQALSSLKNKKFHAQGGSVYAIYPGVNLKNTVKFIVSLQTISDYLDNLCDRMEIMDDRSFRQLHLSMMDAVDPSLGIQDYYLYYPIKSDNNYLRGLVENCRREVIKLPSYDLVKDKIKNLVELYSSLQTYKHLDKNIREDKLISWAEKYKKDYPEINCWEFSAATGSTLGIFIFFAVAHNPKLSNDEINLIYSVYFPWISALHILLDYYIDSDEDKEMGDLNFTHYYTSLDHCEQRLTFFIDRSIKQCSKLPNPDFHLTVIRGLLAMYLSDPKAFSKDNVHISRKLIKKGGTKAQFYFNLCRLLRYSGKI